MSENIKIVKDGKNCREQFDKIGIGKNFIYSTNVGDFECTKIHERLACTLDIDNYYFCLKAYANCLSLGAYHVPKYNKINSIDIEYELNRQR